MKIPSSVRIINRDIFVISLITMVVFFLLDIMLPGIISNYFNSSILFFIMFVSGLLYSLFFPIEASGKRKK